jgi:hypothetical protein
VRTRVAASDLKPGMVAFLPYWGRLLKSKIARVTPYDMKSGSHVGIYYVAVAKTALQCESLCIMKSSSVYEVYTRKPSQR